MGIAAGSGHWGHAVRSGLARLPRHRSWLHDRRIRAVVAQKIAGSTWATLSYANGKALAFDSPDSAVTVDEAVQGFTQRRTEAVRRRSMAA